MGRNKDSLIALAEKLTGETCGEVKTKKDALKKIACFYAGEEVECNTVADALQCIAEHCSGGSGGVSGSKVTLYCHLQNEDPASYYLTQDPIANVGKEQTLISIVGPNINTSTVTVTDATEGYSKVTTENGSTVTLIRSSSGDITFDCGESSSDENAITIPEVLQNTLVQTMEIPNEVDGNISQSFMLNTVEDYYILIKAPNNEVLLDDIKYLGGQPIEIIPETKITGSGSYSYKVEYTVISEKQVSISVTTTAYSYNAGSVDIYICKKDLSN